MQADDTGLKIFYDDLGQVTALKTITGDVWETYTYDNAGNILSASRNGGARQDTYTYADSTWKDLLTGFNNESIVYDEIGNPLIYRGWN